MEHPAIHDLAAYLEHRLDDASRRRVESHLAECDQCRREVVDGERVLRAAPDRRTSVRRPIAVLAGLAAAALVLFTVLHPSVRRRRAEAIEAALDRPASEQVDPKRPERREADEPDAGGVEVAGVHAPTARNSGISDT